VPAEREAQHRDPRRDEPRRQRIERALFVVIDAEPVRQQHRPDRRLRSLHERIQRNPIERRNRQRLFENGLHTISP
jgi:hypothetical protein